MGEVEQAGGAWNDRFCDVGLAEATAAVGSFDALSVHRGGEPPIQGGDGNAEAARHVLRRDSAGKQFLRRFDLAFRHQSRAPTYSAELPGNFETRASSLDDKLPFHLLRKAFLIGGVLITLRLREGNMNIE